VADQELRAAVFSAMCSAYDDVYENVIDDIMAAVAARLVEVEADLRARLAEVEALPDWAPDDTSWSAGYNVAIRNARAAVRGEGDR
jgi:hypothetical protein